MRMATKRKSKARRKKAAPRIRVIDLKKVGTSLTRLKKALKKASRGNVCLVVRNAPFRLSAA
jgi:hypothetical protein